jgi:hypothetical protein
MLGGHTVLNSTHAKSCRLNLYGADRSTFLLPITSAITTSYVRLPILTVVALILPSGSRGLEMLRLKSRFYPNSLSVRNCGRRYSKPTPGELYHMPIYHYVLPNTFFVPFV